MSSTPAVQKSEVHQNMEPKHYNLPPGPIKRRSCTDVICLTIFVTFIICWIAIAAFAFLNGQPQTLLVPKDSYGSRCGLDDHVKNKPYLFFFDLTSCLKPRIPFSSCPTKQICVEQCPSTYFYWGKPSKNVSALICDYDIHIAPNEGNVEVETGSCARWYLPSISIKNRCVPSIHQDFLEKIQTDINVDSDGFNEAVKILRRFSNTYQVGQNIVEDLVTSRWGICLFIGGAVCVTIIYILIMRWIAGVMVWLSITGVLSGLGTGTYFSLMEYIARRNHPVDNNDDTQNSIDSFFKKESTWLAITIIAATLFIIFFLMIIFLRKRILLSIALIKEGSKAVSSSLSVLFFPLIPWILQISVIIFTIAVGVYLFTSGDPIYKIHNMETGCSCRTYKNNSKCIPTEFMQHCSKLKMCNTARCQFIGMGTSEYYSYLQGFNIFGLFWGTFFTLAFGEMVLASVFATWYWTSQKKRLPFFAITQAVLQTLCYHVGTLAFGSLIIAICRLIRIILEYIDHKLKKYNNDFTKAILCIMKCCFWCLENFIKFINRNAYIMCAIYGWNFCSSAREAFNLLVRNVVRVVVLDKVTDLMFFFGKILITLGVGATAYVVYNTDLTKIDIPTLNYKFVPIVVISIVTYFIASVFFNVYSMAVDTLFLCFLEDYERNDGSAAKPYLMSKNLMKILGKRK